MYRETRENVLICCFFSEKNSFYVNNEMLRAEYLINGDILRVRCIL